MPLLANLEPRRAIGTAFLVCLSLLATQDARAQGLAVPGGLTEAGALNTAFPVGGSWAQVVSVTPNWIVLQTDNGQQFPVSVSAIQLFVVRWPTTPELLAPDAWAEVTGLDINSNQVLASQVDVYEGAARNLVSPISQVIVGYNRVVTQPNLYQFNTFSFVQPLPGEDLMPRRRHVVGPVVSRDPLALAVGGNDAVQVVPSAAGVILSQVTPGSTSFVQTGDVVWCSPVASTPRTLALGQLVVYKRIPASQFVP